MIPGGRLNDRNMRIMMKRMGMSTEEISEVEEVIIRRKDDELVLESPEVTVITVQGVKTFQVVGEPKSRPRTPSAAAGTGNAPPAPPPFTEEDVAMVMDHAHVERAEAEGALREAGGEPAEAILHLLARRKG